MIRSCVSWCRHLLCALVVLALLACLIEVGLRVYDSATGQVTRRELYDRGMVCKSWSVHHGLKPSRKFSVRNPDGDARIQVALNGLGMRGPEPAVPKTEGILRILCLGDELTLAPQVPDSETYCSGLERELASQRGPRCEVLNAGVPDYCPLLSYLQLKHQLLGLQADLIIVNFEMGDVADDYQHRRMTVMAAGGLPLSCAHPALEMARAGGGMRGKSTADAFLLPQWCRHRLGCLWATHSLGADPQTIDSPHSRFLWLEDQCPDWSVYVDQALSPLAHIRDLAASFGARVIVVVCPAPWQVSAVASNGEKVREKVGVPQDALYRSRRPFETIAEFCRNHQLAFCDLSIAFQQAPQPERLFLTNAAAFSPEGHALYARQIAVMVEQQMSGARVRTPPPNSMTDGFPDLPQAQLPPR